MKTNQRALYASFCACLMGSACDADEPTGGDVIESGSNAVEQLRAIDDLEDIAACYGVGHDAIFFDLGGPQVESLSILGGCFAPDVHSEFVFFGGDAVPLEGLPALISFIETFAIDTGYHSARNTPGNVRVELLDDDDAVVTTAGATPHFSLASLDEPFIDLITARYTHVVHRDDDGGWRTTELIVEIDEVARFDAAYDLGQ